MRKTGLVVANIVALTLCTTLLHSQQTPNPIPASPTVAELGRYGAIPIGLNTGIPNISIPIYNLNLGTFSLPISLSYHGSGIRVNDIASWVGLGWSLNAGGAISVNIKGASDLSSDREFVTEEEIKNLELPSTTRLTCAIRGHCGDNLIDMEPDIYNYNFCGFSGQFVLDKDYNIYFLKNNGGLKLTPIKYYNTDRSRWELKFEGKDIAGNKYYFEDFEFTDITPYGIGWDFFHNSMYPRHGISDFLFNDLTGILLSRIVLANGQGTITFKYIDEVVKYSSPYSGSIMWYNLNSTKDWQGSDNIFSVSDIYNHTRKLVEIECASSKIKISFLSEHAREDILNTAALSKIELWNNDINLLDWEFDYSNYFLSDIVASDYIGNPTNKRLKLNKVTKKTGNGDESDNPWIFTYYGDETGETKLPPRNSCDGFDHWGFCNKSITTIDYTNPFKLFPSIQENATRPDNRFICLGSTCGFAPPPGHPVEPCASGGTNNIKSYVGYRYPVTEFPGGDRSPNISYTKAFALKKIIYPTGGYTLFDYELNNHTIEFSSYHSGTGNTSASSGLRIRSIADFTPGESVNERTYTYSGGIAFGASMFFTPLFITSDLGDEQAIHWNYCGTDREETPDGLEPLSVGYTLYTESQESLSLFGGDYVSYTSVEESSSDGMALYTYSGRDDPYTFNYYWAYIYAESPESNFYGEIRDYTAPVYPFSNDYTKSFTGNACKRGLLEHVNYSNNEGNLIKEEIYEYNFYDLGKVVGNQVSEILPGATTMINAYHLYSGKSFPKKKTTILYDKNAQNPVTQVDEFIYDIPTELITEQTSQMSDGSRITKKFVYPFSYSNVSNGFIGEMKTANILDKPVEVYTHNNSSEVISGEFTAYKTGTNVGLPDKVHKLEITTPLTLNGNFYPSNTNGFNPSTFYRPTLSFDSYSAGKLQQYHKENDVNVSYLWGYNNTYPTAKATNAASSQIAYTSFNEYYEGNWTYTSGNIITNQTEAKAGNTYLQMSGSGNISKSIAPGKYLIEYWAKSSAPTISGATVTDIYTSAADAKGWINYVKEINATSNTTVYLSGSGYIDELRIYPSDAQMTTYTYKPLVGMTSQTDENNITTYYEYDSFGRLLRILDQDLKVLQQFEYKYAQ